MDRLERDAQAWRVLELRRGGLAGWLVFPYPEIEAWPIAVFTPVTKAAEARVAELTRRLGFSPIDHPERLTSSVLGGLADAKSIRDTLFEGDVARVDAWLELDLHILRERGATSGLSDLLDEIRAVVVPLLGAPPGMATPSLGR